MADSIVRLKVDSQEYDNKLKRAAEGLQRYADGCRQVGGTLSVVEDETLAFVRAVGQMDTVSRTATGKLSEMKRTFTELAVQYKQLTDEEKQSPFGKALAQSLDQLKGRINESKSQLDDINKSINGGGGLTGALDNLAGKFGMSVQSLASWGTALAAGKAALDVAKDAFFASEATVDEWGRVMDSSKSLYEGFLTSLNTGDISGFLGRIDSIVQAARAAYDELDRLGTMKTIQAPQMSAQQTENERMRMMIQTGRYVAPVDGRRASMQNGQLLTPDQIKRIEQQLQGGMQKVVTLVGKEVAQTGRAIDAVYNRQAQELGMSLSEFRKGTSSMAEFDKRIAGYQKYEQWRKDNSFKDAWGNRQVRPGNPYEEYKKWNTFRVDGDRYNNLVKLIQQRDQQAGQAYSMQSQAYRTMNRAEGVTLRQLMGGGSGGRSAGGGGNTKTELNYATDSIMAQQAEVSRLTKLWQSAGAVVRDDYKAQLDEAQYLLDRMTGKEKFDPTKMRELMDLRGTTAWASSSLFTAGTAPVVPDTIKFSDSLAKRMEYEEKQRTKDIEKPEANLLENTQDLIGGLSSVASGLSQMGIELPDGVQKVLGGMQGLMSVIQGVQTILNIFTTTTTSAQMASLAANSSMLVANTAALSALTGAIATNTVTNLFPLASGGVVKAAGGYRVPGRTFSGDLIPARLNAGELVLNQAQAGVIANALQDRDFSGGSGMMQPYVDGEKIFLGMNNTSKRMGRGEIVTTGTLRRLGLI